jgi:hypothetical protein
MKNKLIFHGHFYQPPRENPDTGVVPRQPSAAPFHDWNARITRECYGANAASRYLNEEGRILDILNNYEFISFNFGPTLLNWLEENASSVYRGIVEADKVSRDGNGGHGNALAQSYNHTILPLDPPEVRRMQIAWGISDFERHFGRKPEGMWLPETGVNLETAEMVAEAGIRFIILSPWQAEAVRHGKKWKLLGKEPAPSNRPFRLHGLGGDLAVFFYNHRLAEGISFQHFLRDAESLYRHLLEYTSPDNNSHLIHTATDGEVYGHHEPFGDMCLAALVKRIHDRNDFELTNYAAYLDEFPPTEEVRLKPGEDDRGTSWSCAHGVSRWYKDCGCSTGGEEGWTQNWRGPLRSGFTFLYREARKIYSETIAEFTREDPLKLLENYGTVELSAAAKLDFAKTYLSADGPLKRTDLVRFFRLLEGQRYAMYMFTSCGWFFSEISGIEPVQNMKYAYEVIKLYSPFFDDPEEFLDTITEFLENAPSNTDAYEQGADIFEREVIRESRTPEYLAGLLAIEHFTRAERTNSRKYGQYLTVSYREESRSEDGLRVRAEITVEDLRILERTRCGVLLDISDPDYALLTVENYDSSERRKTHIPLKSLPYGTRKLLVDTYNRCIPVPPDRGPFSGRLKCAVDILSFARMIEIEPPRHIISLAEYRSGIQLQTIFSRDVSSFSAPTIAAVRRILRDTKRFSLRIDDEYVKRRISGLLSDVIDRLSTGTVSKHIDLVIDLLEISREADIAPELAITQNKIFSLLRRSTRESMGPEVREKLIEAAHHLGIAVDG